MRCLPFYFFTTLPPSLVLFCLSLSFLLWPSRSLAPVACPVPFFLLLWVPRPWRVSLAVQSVTHEQCVHGRVILLAAGTWALCFPDSLKEYLEASMLYQPLRYSERNAYMLSPDTRRNIRHQPFQPGILMVMLFKLLALDHFAHCLLFLGRCPSDTRCPLFCQ